MFAGVKRKFFASPPSDAFAPADTADGSPKAGAGASEAVLGACDENAATLADDMNCIEPLYLPGFRAAKRVKLHMHADMRYVGHHATAILHT